MKKIKINRKGKIRLISGCDGINLCSNINNKAYFLINKNKENLNKKFYFFIFSKTAFKIIDRGRTIEKRKLLNIINKYIYSLY